MSAETAKPRRRRLVWIAAAVFAALAAIAAAPFFAATQVARLALIHLYPANSPSVGSVTLSTGGRVVIHDLVLHDTGALADRPLIAAGEVDATFAWSELLAARKLGRIRVAGVHIYARSNASS